MTDQLSREEDELYDRQIRVWGVETQCAIKSTTIAVVLPQEKENDVSNGAEEEQRRHHLIAEVVKNVLLAGVGEMVLHVENKDVIDLGFLGVVEKTIEANILGLNPKVKLQIVRGKITAESILEHKPQVILINSKSLCKIDEMQESISSAITHSVSSVKAIFSTSMNGGCGFAFLRAAQNLDQNLAVALRATLQVSIEKVPRRVNKMYSVLRAVFNFELENKRLPRPNEEDFERLFNICSTIPEKHQPSQDLLKAYLEEEEMPAVAAVLGGVLAQEILKSISGKGDLMHNFFYFSAHGSKDSGEGKVESIVP